MTLLDDYEVDYKIHGVLLTEILLTHAHPELLKRTGVGDLIFSVCFVLVVIIGDLSSWSATLEHEEMHVVSPQPPDACSSARGRAHFCASHSDDDVCGIQATIQSAV